MRRTSSEDFRKSTFTSFSSTFNPTDGANCKIFALVMPGSIPEPTGGVMSLFPFIIKIFLVVPSRTKPSVFRSIASSAPFSFASFLASICGRNESVLCELMESDESILIEEIIAVNPFL